MICSKKKNDRMLKHMCYQNHNNSKLKKANKMLQQKIKGLKAWMLMKKPMWSVAMKRKEVKSNLDILIQASETILWRFILSPILKFCYMHVNMQCPKCGGMLKRRNGILLDDLFLIFSLIFPYNLLILALFHYCSMNNRPSNLHEIQ